MNSREELMNRFEKLNSRLYYNGDYMSLIVCGASYIIITTDKLDRYTSDVDVLTDIRDYPKYKKLMEELEINCDMLKVAIIPQGFESRMELAESFTNLRIYVLDIYDYIITKLGTNRDRSDMDIDDIKKVIDNFEDINGLGEFDFEELKVRVCEAYKTNVGYVESLIYNFNNLSYQYFWETRIDRRN